MTLGESRVSVTNSQFDDTLSQIPIPKPSPIYLCRPGAHIRHPLKSQTKKIKRKASQGGSGSRLSPARLKSKPQPSTSPIPTSLAKSKSKSIIAGLRRGHKYYSLPSPTPFILFPKSHNHGQKSGYWKRSAAEKCTSHLLVLVLYCQRCVPRPLQPPPPARYSWAPSSRAKIWMSWSTGMRPRWRSMRRGLLLG